MVIPRAIFGTMIDFERRVLSQSSCNKANRNESTDELVHLISILIAITATSNFDVPQLQEVDSIS